MINKLPYLVGLCGGEGSGTAALAKALAEKFPDTLILRQEDYYRSRDDLAYPERVRLNYEAPAAFDFDLLTAHLRGLRWGNAVDTPIYDPVRHLRSNETYRAEPAALILVTGPLLYADPTLAAQFDGKIFLDTDADIRFIRRLLTETEQQRSLYTVAEEYLTRSRPAYIKYIAPGRDAADLVLSGDAASVTAVAQAAEWIAARMDAR